MKISLLLPDIIVSLHEVFSPSVDALSEDACALINLILPKNEALISIVNTYLVENKISLKTPSEKVSIIKKMLNDVSDYLCSGSKDVSADNFLYESVSLDNKRGIFQQKFLDSANSFFDRELRAKNNFAVSCQSGG